MNKSSLEKQLKKHFGNVKYHQAETGSEYFSGNNLEGVPFVVRISNHPFVYKNSGVFIDAVFELPIIKRIIEEIKLGIKSSYYIDFRKLREEQMEAEKEIGKNLKNMYWNSFERYLKFNNDNPGLTFDGDRREAREVAKWFGISPVFVWAIKRKVRTNFSSLINAINSFNRN